jgi:hypothetical protein
VVKSERRKPPGCRSGNLASARCPREKTWSLFSDVKTGARALRGGTDHEKQARQRQDRSADRRAPGAERGGTVSTILWTVPRVEVPTRLGLVVVALRRGRAVVISGKALFTPIRLLAQEANLLEPAREAVRLTPADGDDYLRGLAEVNRGARYVSGPSEILERRPFYRRRGRISAELLTATGIINVNGEGMSDAGRRWLSQRAVPSLRREWREFVEEAARRAR